MEKIEFNGETYYTTDDGDVLDEHFITVPKDIFLKIVNKDFSLDNYQNKSSEELLDAIKFYKNHEVFSLAQSLIMFGLKKFGNDICFIRMVLPILTSCYRNLRQPEEAIRVVKQYANSITESPALYVSAAAAYCDIDDTVNARKCANIAYSQLADLSDEYKDEIRKVYQRIKALEEA